MKFLIILGFLMGFGGVLAAAGFAPIAVQERVASRTSVANNGGRLETFIVRLPSDRIATTGSALAGVPGIDPVSRIDPPESIADSPYLIEQFKLRNLDGEVIGIAARHWTQADAQSHSTWQISIPSRGTLVWSSPGNTPATLAAAIAAQGAQAGSAWEDAVTVAVAVNENEGRVLAGTEEFAGSSGLVEEAWEISGIGGNGELRGTISLDTRVSRVQ